MIDPEEVKAMRATRLKLVILSTLGKSRLRFAYAHTVRYGIRWASDEEFAECIATLVEQNFITQTKGRQGGPRLTLVEGAPNGK
jgi:hypothetical protein